MAKEQDIVKIIDIVDFNEDMLPLLNRNIKEVVRHLENAELYLKLDGKPSIQSLKNGLESAETSISQTADEIALKATKTELNAVTGRLEDTEAELVVQAGQISSKVSQTEHNAAINGLDGRVDSAETSIIQNANEIALRATKTQVNGIDGRLVNAESTISIQAGQIASKVSSGEIGTLITQNPDSVKIAVGQIGSNNLIKNSNFKFGANWELWSSPGVAYLNGAGGSKYIKVTKNNVTSGFGVVTNPINITSGKKYTLSLDGSNVAGSNVLDYIYLLSASQGNFRLDDIYYNNKKITFTAPYSADDVKVLIGKVGTNVVDDGFRLFYVKLEEGENATSWSSHADELKTSSFEVTDEHARFTGDDGSYTEFVPSSTGLKWHKGATAKDYHYLSYIGSGTATLSGITITLPAEFKGKDFKVALSLRSFDALSYDRWLYKVSLYVSNYDIPNGKFTVVGYANYGYSSAVNYNKEYGYLTDMYGTPHVLPKYFLFDGFTPTYTGVTVNLGFDYVVTA